VRNIVKSVQRVERLSILQDVNYGEKVLFSQLFKFRKIVFISGDLVVVKRNFEVIVGIFTLFTSQQILNKVHILFSFIQPTKTFLCKLINLTLC
jgi:hypothetical protein